MPTVRTADAPIHYLVDAADTHAHLYRITLTVARPAALQELALPVWIPGSYLVREFAKNLQRLAAQQNGTDVPVEQLDKQRWRVRCRRGQPLILTYEVAAYDHSVRTAWLDAQRGFFNATSLCLRVCGQEDAPHALQVTRAKAQADWQLATALTPLKISKNGFGSYRAANYDELADSPVELGPFQSYRFKAAGVEHRLVVAGAAPSFDSARLLADMRRICEAAIAFWHGTGKPPFARYLFLLNVVDDGYGGLEHQNSTALICARRDLPRLGEAKPGDGYTTLLGLVSHEYFHAWNVKRMRPQELARYDYDRENYTELLWFFEGFTSYYDDLLLRRAGLIDDGAYLKLITKTMNQVLQAPGRQVQSVAQASFDAWVKYYRQDENTPNATISYYTKGALVALCLDLALRQGGKATLDDVMRALWQASGGGPITEANVRACLKSAAGRDLSAELEQWVHGTQDLPLADLLAAHGVQLHHEPAQLAQRLGLRMDAGMRIKVVLRGGAAEQAGMMAGDEWLALEVDGQAWRLQNLDDLPLYAGAATNATTLVTRDRRLLRLPLALPPASASGDTVRLEVRDAALTQRWLAAAT